MMTSGSRFATTILASQCSKDNFKKIKSLWQELATRGNGAYSCSCTYRANSAYQMPTAHVVLEAVHSMYEDAVKCINICSIEGGEIPTSVLNDLDLLYTSLVLVKDYPKVALEDALKNCKDVVLDVDNEASMVQQIKAAATASLKSWEKHIVPAVTRLKYRCDFDPRQQPVPINGGRFPFLDSSLCPYSQSYTPLGAVMSEIIQADSETSTTTTTTTMTSSSSSSSPFSSPAYLASKSSITKKATAQYMRYTEEYEAEIGKKDGVHVVAKRDDYTYWTSKLPLWPELARIALWWIEIPVASIAYEACIESMRTVFSHPDNYETFDESTINRDLCFRVNMNLIGELLGNSNELMKKGAMSIGRKPASVGITSTTTAVDDQNDEHITTLSGILGAGGGGGGGGGVSTSVSHAADDDICIFEHDDYDEDYEGYHDDDDDDDTDYEDDEDDEDDD